MKERALVSFENLYLFLNEAISFGNQGKIREYREDIVRLLGSATQHFDIQCSVSQLDMEQQIISQKNKFEWNTLMKLKLKELSTSANQ